MIVLTFLRYIKANKNYRHFFMICHIRFGANSAGFQISQYSAVDLYNFIWNSDPSTYIVHKSSILTLKHMQVCTKCKSKSLQAPPDISAFNDGGLIVGVSCRFDIYHFHQKHFWSRSAFHMLYSLSFGSKCMIRQLNFELYQFFMCQ